MFAFAYRVKNDVLTLDFFDVISRYYVSASQVGEALEKHSDASSIRIRIYSPGGSVYEGLAIRSLLREDGRPITVKIIGLAASMATVIASSIGATVTIDPAAEYMVHNPWTIAIGDAREMRRAADQLEKLEARTAKLYKQKANLSLEEIRALMSAETWMSAEEAVKAGFVDSIDDSSKDRDDQTKNESSTPAATVNSWQGVTKQFKRQQIACFSRWTQTAMAYTPAFLASLGFPAGAAPSEAEIEAAVAKRGSPDPASFVPRADYDAAIATEKKKREDAEAMVKAREAEEAKTFETRVNASIDLAVKEGRIAPASKDYHRESIMSRADREQGLMSFVKMTQITPPLLSGGEDPKITKARAADPKTGARSPEQSKILSILGTTEEEADKMEQEIRSLPDRYPPGTYFAE